MTPETIVELLKIGGVPGMVLALIGLLYFRRGPDQTTSEVDAVNVEVAKIRSELTAAERVQGNHETRIAVIEAIMKERDKK